MNTKQLIFKSFHCKKVSFRPTPLVRCILANASRGIGNSLSVCLSVCLSLLSLSSPPPLSLSLSLSPSLSLSLTLSNPHTLSFKRETDWSRFFKKLAQIHNAHWSLQVQRQINASHLAETLRSSLGVFESLWAFLSLSAQFVSVI